MEVHLHISGSFVVTVHRDRCVEFDRVQSMLERTPPESEAALVYRVIDALTDSLLDVLDRVASEVDDYEAIVGLVLSAATIVGWLVRSGLYHGPDHD